MTTTTKAPIMKSQTSPSINLPPDTYLEEEQGAASPRRSDRSGISQLSSSPDGSSTTANSPFNSIINTQNHITEQTHKYRLQNNCLSPRKNHAIAVSEDQETIYVFGGQCCSSKGDLLGCLHKYDANEMNWTEYRRPERDTPGIWPSRRKGHTLVAVGKALFLFGGVTVLGGCNSPSKRSSLITNTNPPAQATTSNLQVPGASQRNETVIYFNDVWRFDLEREYWSEITVEGEQPTGRAHHTANVQGYHIIMYGGYGCHEDSDVWAFDTVNNVWSRLPSSTPQECRPQRRYGHVSTVYEDCLYIFGGQQKNKLCDPSVWYFNLTKASKGVWTKIEVSKNSVSVATSRVFLAASRVGQKWFMHGGSNKGGVTNLFHEFDLRTLKWRSLNSILPHIPSLEMHTGATFRSAGSIISFLVLGGTRPYMGPLDLTGKCESYRVDFVDICQSQWGAGRTEDAYVGWLVREVIIRNERRKAGPKHDQELAGLKELYKTSEQENEALQAENDELKEGNDQLQAANDELKEGNDQLQAENDQLKAELEALKLKYARKDDGFCRAQAKLRRLADRHTQLMKICSKQRTAIMSTEEIVVVYEEVEEITREFTEVFEWIEKEVVVSDNTGQLEVAEEDRLIYSERDLQDLTEKYAKLQKLHKKLMAIRDQDILKLQDTLKLRESREKSWSKALDSHKMHWKEVWEAIQKTLVSDCFEEITTTTTCSTETNNAIQHKKLLKKSFSVAVIIDKNAAVPTMSRNSLDANIIQNGGKSHKADHIDSQECVQGVRKLAAIIKKLQQDKTALTDQFVAANNASQVLERALRTNQQLHKRNDQHVQQLISSIDALNEIKIAVEESRKSFKSTTTTTTTTDT